MQDLIADLDAYFCEVYANYDRLCGLPEYRMPTMQATKTDDFGRTVAYTLPANTMRLALQEHKETLLKALKDGLVDKTFSFSFRPFGFFEGIKERFSKYSFFKHFQIIAKKHNVDLKETVKHLSIDNEVWENICNGKFEPSKNLIFSVALVEHFTFEETRNLLYTCGYDFDYTMEKDVVISYLLTNNVYNEEMVKTALREYKISNLFLA